MSTPIRVLIVDDESLGRERIRQLLQDQPDVEIIGECENGMEAIRAIESLSPDLVYLDVMMPELDGIGVLNALGPARAPEVIFTTAHSDYMERAFESHALDYLRKPFRESRFRESLHHAMQRIRARRGLPLENDPRVRALLADLAGERMGTRLKIAERDGELRFIEADEVYFLEAEQNQVRVHTGGGPVTWRTTLTEADRVLDPTIFLRVHRSYIVNTTHIRRVSRIGKGEYFLELANGRKIGTGRSYREAVESFMNR